MITLGNMFRELNSFVPCSNRFAQADASPVNTKNNRDFKALVRDWSMGAYDEDPGLMVQRLEKFLK